MRSIYRCLSATVVLAFGFNALAADTPKAKAEELFPDTTFAALVIPDLSAARAAAGKTRLADMYAQPDIQAFLAPPLAQLKSAYNDLRAKNALLPALEDLDAGIFSGEFAQAVYLRAGDRRMPIRFVAILAPKDLEAYRRLVPKNVRDILTEGQVVPLGGGEDDPAIACLGGRVLFCMPQADIGPILSRLKDPASRNKNSLASNAGFTALNTHLGGSAAFLYVSPAKLLDAIMTDPEFRPGANAAAIQSMLKATGISNLNSAGFSLGFNATDPICEAFLGFNVPPKDDLFALFNSTAPITPEGLKIASPDSPYVAGMFVNFSGVIPFIRTLAAGAGPEFSNGLAQVLDLSKLVLGFDVQKDLLENLGGEVVVAQTVVDTGAPLSFAPGLTASIPLKDAAKVEACLKKIGDALDRASENLEGAGKLAKVRVKRLEHHGKPIYYLTGQVLAGPVAFAIVGNRLLVCSSYNAARRGIEQLETNTDILSKKDFQDTIARLTGKPFDAKALPSSFAFSVDRGSGTGALLLAGLGLTWATASLAAAAEMPGIDPNAAPNAAAANANAIAIPENEKAAIFACRAFAEAEEIYHRTDYTGNGVLKYSPALKGDNSLLELKAGAGDLALIDKTMGEAEGEPGGKASKRGYRFKVLTGQGKSATGGARSYIANGSMTLGYALVAYPAEYGVTGRKTFMINSNGTTFSRDYGAGTSDAVKAMTAFDPDASWTAADEEAPPAQNFPRGGGGGNEFVQFFSRPSGKAVLSVANAIDLGLWPDEGFFMKYRRPTGAVAVSGADGILWRSELPPPGPASPLGVNPALVVGGIAVVSAIAVPSLLRSRMAANETAAAAACKAYAEAQEIYHRTDYTGNGVLKYAQTLDALYEKTPGAGDIQMIDKTFMQADGSGQNPVPKAGYYFKVLTTQGDKAAGAKRNYVVNGNMSLGYALVAWPASYDGTGRDTFIINNNGTIYQKDMGPETDAIAKAMTEYNPDNTWIPTQ